MSLLGYIKEIVFWEKDDDFFDKEATIKEYFAVCPSEQRRPVNSYEELYTEALKFVSKQNFDENTKDQEDYFYEMNNVDASVAILTGVFAFVIAYEVDKNGGKLEEIIDDLLPEGYDDNNPFDAYKRNGSKHRTVFGHDIFSFALGKIPPELKIRINMDGHSPIMDSIGNVLGKDKNFTMLDLIWHYYGKDKPFLKGIFSCVGHTIVHFSKDLLTQEGVPLPFTALFNQYKITAKSKGKSKKGMGLFGEKKINENGIRIENKVNEQIDRVKGNMKMSDFASLGFIEGMCKIYAESKKMGDKKESFNRDIKILAMGTCIMIQMSWFYWNEIKPKSVGRPPIIAGAKLNVIMASAMLKNMVQEMTVVVKAREEVNMGYALKLKQLEGEC